ncbi:MAG: leucyl aminopeptidase [Legionella sp.]
MNYNLVNSPTLSSSECMVVGVLSDCELPNVLQSLDQEYHGEITKLVNKLGKLGDLIWQAELGGQSLLLINCGSTATYNRHLLKKCIDDTINFLLQHRITSTLISLPQLAQHNADWQVQKMALQIAELQYQLLDLKTKNKNQHCLNSVSFFLPGATETSINNALAMIEGINLTRTLANLPANICTPTYLSQQAEILARQDNRITTSIYHREDLEKMGMGALLAVAQGSHEPPQFAELRYQGTHSTTNPIVIVGKGITFDSGGLSLKPAESMTEMKYDMAGAATVLGTIKACSLLKLPINLVGLIACTENMPSGTATKPGDVVKSLSGQTIEILNTDAEGRLVLADALTYAERLNPAFVIDIATLTGAIVMALGHINTGFMTDDEQLAKDIQAAAEISGDKVWRMPLDLDYQEALDSPIADMVNATFDRSAGAITAACFLSRFTSKYRWAHLDIAGTAWISGKKRHATGRPVLLLLELLRHVANSR